MSDDRIDSLLNRVPDSGGPADVDVAELMAHARGQLDAEATDALEARLAQDADARGLYVELARTVTRPQVTAPARPWRRAAPVAVLALAAALAVWLLRPAPVPPVGEYAFEPPAGVALLRGDEPAATRTFLPQTRLKLVLTPQAPVAGVQAAAYIARPGQALTRRDVPIQIGKTGAVRAVAPARDWFGAQTGTWDVHVVVGRDLPDLSGQTADAAREATPGAVWRGVRLQYQLTAPEGE